MADPRYALANNAAPLPGTGIDLPASQPALPGQSFVAGTGGVTIGSPTYRDPQVYGPGQQYSTPEAQAAANGFWPSFWRVLGSGARGAGLGLLGGPGGAATGAAGGVVRGGIKEIFRNRARPLGTMTAEEIAALANGEPAPPDPAAAPPPRQRPGVRMPGFSGQALFSGLPVNQANWANYTRTYAHPGQGYGQGTNAFERSGTGTYSDRASNLASSAANIATMEFQKQIGFGHNETGTTGDAGHDSWNPHGGFIGRVNPETGQLESVPTGSQMYLNYRGEDGGGYGSGDISALPSAAATGPVPSAPVFGMQSYPMPPALRTTGNSTFQGPVAGPKVDTRMRRDSFGGGR